MSGGALSYTIPVPVGGLNTRDSLDGMDPIFARNANNVFFDEQKISLKKGFEEYATGMGTGAVETLAENISTAGTHTFIAAANNNLYNVSSSGTASSVKNSGITSNRWQTLQRNGKLLFFNGVDQPLQWDGSSITDATYTGVADDATLIQATNYRDGLYCVQTGSTKIWYIINGATTGALTEFDVGGLLRFGGYVMWCVGWSQNAGDNSTMIFVICSSEGELLFYAGDSPTGTFQMVGRRKIPKPIGRRSYLEWSGDIEVLTVAGVIPLSAVLATGNEKDVLKSAYTYYVAPTWQGYTKSYKSNFGWQGCAYVDGKYVIYNIPTVDGSQSKQLARNIFTGSWSPFSGQNGFCWATYNDALYFGGGAGKVFKADTTLAHNNANIEASIDFAYNYFGRRDVIKQLDLIAPLMTTNGAVTLFSGVDTDFRQTELANTIEITASEGAEWDVAEWDVAEWADDSAYTNATYSVAALGRAHSLKFAGQFLNRTFDMFGVQVTYKQGGYL